MGDKKVGAKNKWVVKEKSQVKESQKKMKPAKKKKEHREPRDPGHKAKGKKVH